MTQVISDGVRLMQTEHRIGNTTYIVKSAVRKDAEKTILSKVGKLIKNDIAKNN